MNLRQLALAPVLAAGLLLSSPAFAFVETSPSTVNVDEAGLAIRGYDPVAYQSAGAPTPGDPAISATHDGATYRFASEANRALFLADPAKYLPAYGGFCAMGASYGRKFDGDPMQWRVVDGRLYLNVHENAMRRWLENIPGNITRADRNWPGISDKAPADL